MKKLNKENIEDIFALTPLQEGMLFHFLKDPKSDYYFEQLSLEISGGIVKEIYEKAWNFVIETNEMLRTVFRWEKLDKPTQVVLKKHNPRLGFFDLSAIETPVQRQKQLEKIKSDDRKVKFNLREVPFRVTLCKIEKNKYEMIISNHHILYDGWSNGIILRELFSAYNSFYNRKELVKPVKTKFKEFIKCIKKQDEIRQQNYWKDYLKSFDMRTPLPIKEKDANPNITDEIRKYRYQFPGEFTTAVSVFLKEQEITLASLLYSAWGILMQKYNDTPDVVFGTTVAGRNAAVKNVENIVGLFINTLPLRVRREHRTTALDLLQQVHDSLQVREQYENTSLADIKKKSELEGKEEIFDTILVIENYPLDRALAETETDNDFCISIDSYSTFYLTNYDLTVAIGVFGDIDITFTYRENVFANLSIQRLMGHIQVIINEIKASPWKKVSEIDILTPREKEQLVIEFNQSSREYPLDKSIHELFEEQVGKKPDATAVISTETTLSYRKLNEASNRQARLLQEHGAAPGTVVGMMMEPAADMIVGLLAILKAGSAYLPIAPSLPGERVGFMLENSGAPILLTNTRAAVNFPFTVLKNFEENKHFSLVVTPPRSHIKDFNQLPMPDRSLVNMRNYKNKIGMASVTDCISLQTTRGCPFECLYCHKIWSKKHVFRSAENIFNEIQFYYKNGVTNFACIDDCFNLNMENSARLFRLVIQNKLKIQLFFPNGLRGDIMTPDYIDLMAEAGTRGINLSLETASPRLQKLLKKKLNLDNFKKVVDYIAGQHPEVMLEMATMHGFPSETQEEAMMTLDFIKDIKWLHFPYIHILKIFPNTEMEEFALAHGVKKKDIMLSKDRAFHELPETLPFPKSFTRKYQADFMNQYFLNKDRLQKVLPVQSEILDEEALVQKYNAYLPVEIRNIEDIIKFAQLDDLYIQRDKAGEKKRIPNIFDQEIRFPVSGVGNWRILFLDLSQHFSSHSMLYNVAEQPLGLIYLLTHLKEKFGDKIDGRIYKAGNDFDSFGELKTLVFDYNPHLVAIRTLTFFKEFFHETVSMLRQWGVAVPFITGGPYASSDFDTILKDRNIDLVVFGEGEETLAELIERMIEKDFQLPSPEVLTGIKGIAFAREQGAKDRSRTVISVDRLQEEIQGQNPGNLEPAFVPLSSSCENNLAYVMYTSGSTGAPKGVLVEHRQVNNCLHWMQEQFSLGTGDTVVQRTDLAFDPSVWEIFWPLQEGGKTRIIPDLQRKDARYLIRLMAGNRDRSLTVMYCPASLLTAVTHLLNTMGEKPRLTLRWLMTGAESISMEAVKNFYNYFEGRVINTYGPTEGTINNTYYYLHPGDRLSFVPIGKPVANNKIYILSRELKPMPLGVAGEICIAGESVARGYIHQQEKAGPGFISNPFAPGRLYRTGDMGRWLEDGNIQIIGRSDEQVKVRGYRIELEEVRSVLLGHPLVAEAVVVAKDSRELKEEIRECKKCGIWSNYPGITVNHDNLCNICEKMAQYRDLINRYFKTPADLERKISQSRGDRKGKYDCLLVYACERVATYALYRLLEMGFSVLTVTYDSGHYDRDSLERIKRITREIGVDHVFLRHPYSDRILKESLRTAHTMCKGCIHTSTSLAAEYAHKNGIRFVIGETLSRGQIVDNKLYKFMERGIFDVEEIEKENVKIMRNVASIDKTIYDIIDINVIKDGSVYDKVEFIDFYRYFDVTNEEMAAYLDRKDEYWKSLENRAAYSTDCKICQVGDYNHFKELGYHYTGSAKSWEQRLGHAALRDVKRDLTLAITGKEHAAFLNKLGYQREISLEEVEKHLLAYFVSDRELTVAQLREHVAKKLPEYMIPSYFIPMEKIPLTPVGKIDRGHLPLPDRSRSRLGSTYITPKSSLEKTIAGIWQKVLRVDKVGLEDNFFDIGGNSLDIIQVSNKLKEALSRDIPVVTIFTNPTIALLARNLGQEQVPALVPPRQTARYDQREKGKERLKRRLGKNTGT